MNATSPLRDLTPVEIRADKNPWFFSNPDAPEIRRAGKELEERLRSAPEGVIVPLSLAGGTLNGSCIASILSPPLVALARGEIRNRYLAVSDPSGDSAWDADAALKKQSSQAGIKLVCVWRTVSDVELVGPVDEQIASTYSFVRVHWHTEDGATSRQLAEAENISIQTASNRFAKTAAQGLIHRASRENVSGGGTQHVFVPVE